MGKRTEDVVERLIAQAKDDPKFFRELVFEPESTLSGLDYLSRPEKAALLAINPERLIAGLIGVTLDPGGPISGCGGSCGNSCAGTCNGSCGGTCADSCRSTCGATSCNATTKFDLSAIINPVVNPAFGRQVANAVERVENSGGN
jgi:hypothetical protein